MKRQHLDLSAEFRVGVGNERSQIAVMVLGPGETEGGPDNSHRGADQWLVVLDGEGEATIETTCIPLKAGVALLIEKGERHEIRNTGRGPLKTVNVYVPPAYDERGEPLPAGKPTT